MRKNDAMALSADNAITRKPDEWIDETRRGARNGGIGIVGFEIPCNRRFYLFRPPRSMEEIDADPKVGTDRSKALVEELSA